MQTAKLELLRCSFSLFSDSCLLTQFRVSSDLHPRGWGTPCRHQSTVRRGFRLAGHSTVARPDEPPLGRACTGHPPSGRRRPGCYPLPCPLRTRPQTQAWRSGPECGPSRTRLTSPLKAFTQHARRSPCSGVCKAQVDPCTPFNTCPPYSSMSFLPTGALVT